MSWMSTYGTKVPK